MMKTRIIILAGILLTGLHAAGQDWIGQRFSLDTIVGVQYTHEPKNLNLVKCNLQDNTFYFVEQQGFQQKDNDYQAVIHAIRLDNYEQTEILLPLPPGVHHREHYAKSLWIYDFSFDGDFLLVTTQNELILYKRIHNQNYEVVSTHRHRNLFMGYLHQKSIHFFEEDHDKGFKWFQLALGSDSAVLLRELPYEAPHIVQIQPNRYISHNQQSVFFLSTRYPRIEVYSLDGRHLEDISLDLSPWKAFEDDYIEKTLSVPYGIERIYATKDDISNYSYPKVVMPLRGDLLLLYMQFDTTIGKSVLQYAICEENGHTVRYLRANHGDSTYVAAQFPFTLFQGGFDIGNAAGEGKIVQLTYKTDVRWEGRTHQEYLNELDKYYSEHSPTLAYQIMEYRPLEFWKQQTLHSVVSRKTLSMNELPAQKNVLVLHQGLECSGCTKAIYQLMNQTDISNIHIGHVYPNVLNGMQAYEIGNQLRLSIDKPFSLYYDTSAHYRGLVPEQALQDSDFPCLILFQKGNNPKLFRLSELFTADYGVTVFRETFIQAWHSFLKQ